MFTFLSAQLLVTSVKSVFTILEVLDVANSKSGEISESPRSKRDSQARGISKVCNNKIKYEEYYLLLFHGKK